MIALLLTVAMCSGTGLPVAECEPSNIALYDAQTWIGPTEADMRDCLNRAQTLTHNGNNARCEIVSADKEDYQDASTDVPKVQTKWTF